MGVLSFNEISLLISVTHLSIKSLEPKTPAQNSSILKSRHCVIRCNGFRQKLSQPEGRVPGKSAQTAPPAAAAALASAALALPPAALALAATALAVAYAVVGV